MGLEKLLKSIKEYEGNIYDNINNKVNKVIYFNFIQNYWKQRPGRMDVNYIHTYGVFSYDYNSLKKHISNIVCNLSYLSLGLREDKIYHEPFICNSREHIITYRYIDDKWSPPKNIKPKTSDLLMFRFRWESQLYDNDDETIKRIKKTMEEWKNFEIMDYEIIRKYLNK